MPNWFPMEPNNLVMRGNLYEFQPHVNQRLQRHIHWQRHRQRDDRRVCLWCWLFLGTRNWVRRGWDSNGVGRSNWRMDRRRLRRSNECWSQTTGTQRGYVQLDSSRLLSIIRSDSFHHHKRRLNILSRPFCSVAETHANTDHNQTTAILIPNIALSLHKPSSSTIVGASRLSEQPRSLFILGRVVHATVVDKESDKVYASCSLLCDGRWCGHI